MNYQINFDRLRVPWALGAAMLALGWTAARAQLPLTRSSRADTVTETAVAVSPQSLEEARKELEVKLAEARAKLAAMGKADETTAPPGATPQEVWTRRAALHRLVLLYEQQLNSSSALQEARARKAETALKVQEWTRFEKPPPYSILFTDRLQEEIQAERLKLASNEAAASTRNQLIEENRSLLAQSEGNLRKLNEGLEAARDPAVTARLSWQRDLENLLNQAAAVSIAAYEQQQLIANEIVAESRLRLGLLQRQLVMAHAGATFTRADLSQATSRIDHQARQLERELDEALGRQVRARQALKSAQEALLQTPPGKEPGAANSRAVELVAVRESELEAIDTTVYALRVMLEGGSVERTMWEFRFAAYDSRRLDTLRESERRLAVLTRRLDLWRDTTSQQVNSSASDIQLQEGRLGELAADSDLLPLARERLQALRERELVLQRLVRGINQLQRLSQRWAESLRDAEGNLPLSDRVQNLFSSTRSLTQRLWAFEVFTAEDSITVDGQKITGKRSVTVGKIVMALLILVVGYWITGLLTGFFERVAVKRLAMEANQAHLIRRWLQAFLVMCLLLFSLVSVKIPLTVFAFAGGALAIGLGFGMQTVIKNFVSGLILLFEQPFRVGDVLDVGGQKGTITSVGLRASVLQLWDGTETLIPNSSLLENNVTNWTYTNRKVRFVVSVGVAYGSDPRKIIKLLEEVAERHGLVEKDPRPLVLFAEFGDSTLNFELRFWLDVAKANSALVCSDLRLMISSTFAESGVAIDYPQRDVHLRAPGPIDVRLISTDGQHTGGAPGASQPPRIP